MMASLVQLFQLTKHHQPFVHIEHPFPTFAGVSQNSGESSGSLASLTSTGNRRQLRLNDINETGLWEISIDSNDQYSVKVTGQSKDGT